MDNAGMDSPLASNPKFRESKSLFRKVNTTVLFHTNQLEQCIYLQEKYDTSQTFKKP